MRRKYLLIRGASNKGHQCYLLCSSLGTHHYAYLPGGPVLLHFQWLRVISFSRIRRRRRRRHLRSRLRGV